MEVYYNGQWGTVCDSAFTNVDAGVVCNSLGFGFVLFSMIITILQSKSIMTLSIVEQLQILVLMTLTLKGHWRLFVLVSSFYIFFRLRVIDKAEYSVFKSMLNSPIVLYRMTGCLMTGLVGTFFQHM